ncbi:MAG: 4Fe-4S dicluster domain-containing protein [Deltaproteobacteria bacterium]|nr:4Fe-4S dicluster domain-containing protein [Deltaproteobacteria bacterium]
MSITAKLEVKEQDLLASLEDFFRSILQLDDVSAILVPQRLPMKNVVMPALITDPDQLSGIDPLAPYFPMNASKVVSRLTRKPIGGKIVAVLRPCEIRAFVELVKLNQGKTDDLVMVGLDCLGAYGNTDYFRFVGDDLNESTVRYYKSVLSGKGSQIGDIDLSSACKACEHPVPTGADILIGLFGVDTGDHLLVQSQSTAGEELLGRLNLKSTKEPSTRKEAIDALLAERTAFRDQMFAETSEATDDLEKLTVYLANCVNCYNCRVACPVCYCKECVFVTDVFNHDPSQYLQWSRRKGTIKMPTDTVFYHITRLAHISTACVGCGQCSNACPNDIPVMELFRTIAQRTQAAFDYEAGRDINEAPPLSVFREEEFADVVGID